jgi:hypothetical protein
MNTVNRKTNAAEQHLEMICQGLDQIRIMLTTYFEKKLIQHGIAENAPVAPAPEIIRLQWTGTKIDLTCLIYALWELGVINDGDAELKTIIQCFEYVFNIDLGNYSSSFQDILERKKGFTNITDKLREALHKKIDRSLGN